MMLFKSDWYPKLVCVLNALLKNLAGQVKSAASQGELNVFCALCRVVSSLLPRCCGLQNLAADKTTGLHDPSTTKKPPKVHKNYIEKEGKLETLKIAQLTNILRSKI